MKEKKLYTCEVCHTDYADRNKAVECEKNHKQKFDIVHIKFHPKGMDESGYPLTITIKGKDGEEVMYRRR